MRKCPDPAALPRPSKSGITDHLRQQGAATLRFSPDPPTLLAFASSFQTLLDSQAPISSTHSAYSELLSVSSSAFPPSTLPISALTDLINANATPSTSSSSKSSFSSVSTSLADHNMAGVGTATTAGLDLLGILAEEVDWDPQQRQLGVLGHNLQSHHEAKQKLWAGHILGSLGLIEPDGSRRNSFSTLNAGIPSKPKPNDGYVKARGTDSKSKAAHKESAALGIGEDPLNTMTLTKRTALFYENLYERLCPGIVPRAYIYPKLGRKSHDQDPSFAALALTISLLGLLGLTLPPSGTSRAGERDMSAELHRPFVMPSAASRSRAHETGELRSEATRLIERVLLLRLSGNAGGSGGIAFGQAPTLEAVLTSFFLSVALYSLDDDAGHEAGVRSFAEWKDASFFRFCEAVTLAKILGIDQLGSAAMLAAARGGGVGELSEEVKVWMLLVRAERWWADQRSGYVCQMEAASSSSTSLEGWSSSRKRVKDEDMHETHRGKRARTSLEPLGILTQLGFRSVREDLVHRFRDQLDCWTGRCDAAVCSALTPSSAVRIHDSLATLELTASPHHPAAADPILVDLARQTLRAQLWIACLEHHLVSSHTHAAAPLRPDQPLHIALDTLDLLEDLDQLVLRSLPSAGSTVSDAVHAALHDIRDCVARLPHSRFAAESFSFEQIEAADSPSSATGAVDEARANASSTTITRAAQSVMDNLDRFLNRVVAP